MQLLCADCHRAKTAANIAPATPKQSAALDALFQSRVVPDAPRLLADDEQEWEKVWARLKRARRVRIVQELEQAGVDTTGLNSRAEMVLVREDAIGEDAAEIRWVEDDDSGFGPDSYFARAILKDD